MVSKRRISGLILGVIMATGASAAPAKDDRPQPFSGTLTSQLIPGTTTMRGTVESSLRTLTGDIAPFGPVSGYIQQNVDLATFQFIGYFALDSGNGTIYGYVTGQLVPTDMTYQSFYVMEQVYLTGGTGKLSKLSGSGTGTGLATASGTSTEVDTGTFTLKNH